MGGSGGGICLLLYHSRLRHCFHCFGLWLGVPAANYAELPLRSKDRHLPMAGGHAPGGARGQGVCAAIRTCRKHGNRRKSAKEALQASPVVEKTEMQKLADELKFKYQVNLHYDLPSTGPTTPFEKLRWKFLKDHSNAFCASLSVHYLSCDLQWSLKPTPLLQAVEDGSFVYMRKQQKR